MERHLYFDRCGGSMNRIFIVGPTEHGIDVGDTLHVVAKTKYRDNFLDIYQTDRYEEIGRTGNMLDAIDIARKHGAKKPAII